MIMTLKEFAEHNIKGLSQNCILFVDEKFNEILLTNILDNFKSAFFISSALEQRMHHIAVRDINEINIDNALDFYLKQFHIFTNIYARMTFFDLIRLQKFYKFFLLVINFISLVFWFYILFSNVF
jgi:hypothetical protein